MSYISSLKESLSSISKIDRVIIAVAVIFLCGPSLHQQLLAWTIESGKGVMQIQAAARHLDDLQSGDYSNVISACDRIDRVGNDLYRAAELNESNKGCILEGDGEIIQSVDALATAARTKEERLSGVILLGSFDTCSYDRQASIIKALDSHDSGLLKLAIPLAHFDSFNDDVVIDKLIEVGQNQNYQLAVLQRIFRLSQMKGFDWESVASDNLVAFVLRSERSESIAVRMQANKLHTLVAFSREPDKFFNVDSDGNSVPNLDAYHGDLDVILETDNRAPEDATYINGLSPASCDRAQNGHS